MELHDNDCLAVGKLADIIMIDLYQPNMRPILNISKNIVYSGSKTNIKMTMINGKVLYKNGQFSDTIDIDAIYDKCEEYDIVLYHKTSYTI